MEIFAKIQPLAEAVARIAGKDAIASLLDTEGWSEVPLAIRERSIWSATLNQLRVIEEIQRKMKMAVAAQADAGGIMSRTRFAKEMWALLGSPEEDTGSIADITSERRAQLLYDFQRTDAAAFARWKTEGTPTHLDNFPAQELVRNEHRRVPRDWQERWTIAGGTLYEGRMIALKDDPIWTDISRFERPWPPFDFGSGMGVEDVDRMEAERLGLIAPGQQIENPQVGFNAALSASIAHLSPEARKILNKALGGRVHFDGDTASLS